MPREIAEHFELWKADPSAFLRSDSSQVPSSLQAHYNYTLSLGTSIASHRILWRFVTTTYFDILSALSPSDRYSVSKEGIAFVVAVICTSDLHNREVVEENIIKWVQEGKKYRALANCLGGNLCCYFFLPSEISEWT